MDLELAGRRALVTASSGGIGAAVVQRLARERCAVLVHGRDSTRTHEVAGALEDLGAESVEVVLGDLTDPEAAARVGETAARWRAQILVNNAGPYVEHDWEPSGRPTGWRSSTPTSCRRLGWCRPCCR